MNRCNWKMETKPKWKWRKNRCTGRVNQMWQTECIQGGEPVNQGMGLNRVTSWNWTTELGNEDPERATAGVRVLYGLGVR